MAGPSDKIVARRYARALFQCCADGGQAERVLADLERARGRIVEGGLDQIFKDPRVPAARKKAAAALALGPQPDPLSGRFLDLLIDKKRLDVLDPAAEAFARIGLEARGIVPAKVSSARTLAAGDQEKLRAALKKFSGADEVRLEARVDPGLLGGAVVRVGDMVLDGSLRGGLERIKEVVCGD